jgi:hypothetical protein
MSATPDFPPLVEAYLADLDRALAGADPRERAETVAAVREHAAELLARYGTTTSRRAACSTSWAPWRPSRTR